jgi:hypothetical protein
VEIPTVVIGAKEGAIRTGIDGIGLSYQISQL